MKIELHLIQNFAPSCLNRDDTNSPKDCVFGGVRRARISSQCIKRAIREWWRKNDHEKLVGKRTVRLVEDLADSVAAATGAERSHAIAAAGALVKATLVKKMKLDKKTGKTLTSYMVILSDRERAALADFLIQNWKELAKDAAKAAKSAKPEVEAEDESDSPDEAEDKEAKEDKTPLGKAMKKLKASAAIGEVGISADIAMFGRMLADYVTRNVDAACQVAHAVSTNKVEMEMDFFTAVDDLKADDEDAGAGMMGVIGYNSACFYRYAVVDWGQLVKNLGQNEEAAEECLKEFVLALSSALPTGKQNTFANHQPCDFILASVRHKGAPLSLANAFVQHLKPTHNKDLIQTSVDAMKAYYDKVHAVYGDQWDLDGPFYCGMTQPSPNGDGWENVGSLSALVAKVLGVVREKTS